MTITLRKGPTGAWERPQKRRIFALPPGLTKLRRLWCAVAGVHLVLVAAAGCLLMPDRVRVERAMLFAVTEEVRKYDGLAFVAESPGGIYEAARRVGFDNWIAKVRRAYRIGPDANPEFGEIRKRYLRDLDSLGDRQKEMLFLLALAWAVPMAALYAAVCVMEWITRGRRE